MSEVKWIKVFTDIFNNRKIKQIEMLPDADAILVIWFKILCLAGNINESGLIMLTKDIPYTDEMLSNEFRRPINTIRMALSTFVKFGMIEVSQDIYSVSNWEKYQNIDSLDRIRAQTRNRVARYREQQNLLIESSVTCNATVTQCNATERRKKKEEEERRKKKEENNSADKPHKFTLPSLDEIKKYCEERKNKVDPEKFFHFYESKNWMVGKNKMKNWKSSVITWEKDSTNNNNKNNNKVANKGNFSQRSYSDDDFEKMYSN
jgi:predicted phage replisome organizer